MPLISVVRLQNHMNNQFKQWRWFVSIMVTIRDDGVHIIEKGILSSYEAKIPFKNIPNQLINYTNTPRGLIVLSIFCFFYFIYSAINLYYNLTSSNYAEMFWSLIYLFFSLVFTWSQSANITGFQCDGGNIYFFNVPGKQNPNAFLEHIQDSKHEYFNTPKGSPARQLHFVGPYHNSQTTG